MRTIQDEINELKKQLKPTPVTPEGKPPEATTPSPAELKIQQLTEVISLAVASFYLLLLSCIKSQWCAQVDSMVWTRCLKRMCVLNLLMKIIFQILGSKGLKV